ncbi:MAG TPA: amidohydrolase [Candidatus Enterocloster excrementipullorum]|uniref:Amidohydrolase n=1 Tax=Candidatus Enterocloster excrementipullorum TaxID=2838559 RepID=A0A9D2MYD8_9FIRM|nr:amidohydrolase [Candidatus Enterocloster excrementipullorum]
MSVRYKDERKLLGRLDNQIIDDLFHGSIDMHVHPGPDPVADRPNDSGTMALEAQKAGMAAIVLKSVTYPTASDAYIIQKHLTPELHVFGAVVIAYSETGGLDHAADVIKKQADIGAKVVWFPTFDAKWCMDYLKSGEGIYILDENGGLKPQVYDILKVCKEYNLVVCSGHMSYEETAKLFDACVEMGITKMVATHPLAELSRFTMEQILALADKGAYIEHVYGTLMPRLGNMDPSDYVDCIRAVGAERTILGSDLGQVWDPMPASGMRHYITMMLQFGCTPQEVELMVKTNPAKLLDL